MATLPISDPYASIARPDPYAAIAKPIAQPNAEAPRQGFLGSAADSSGLSMLGGIMAHPLDSIGTVLKGGATVLKAAATGDRTQMDASQNGFIQGVRGTADSLRHNAFEGVQALRSVRHGDVTGAIGHGAAAIPIIGPGLEKSADQVMNNGNASPLGQSYLHDLGQTMTTPGAMGTLFGTSAAMAAPVAGAIKRIGAGGAITGAAGMVPDVIARPINAIPALPGTVLGKIPTADSIKLAGSRILAPGTVGETLVRATKPSVVNGPAGDVASSLQAALPKAIAQNPSIQGVSDLGKAFDAAANAQAQQYGNVVAPYRKPLGEGPYRPSAIDGSSIANAQMQSIPAMNAFEDVPTQDGAGGIANRTAAKADLYRSPISVPTLDGIRVDANQKLNAFYNKQGGDEAAALSNPETARVKAVGDSVRQSLYPVLDANAGLEPGTVANMQNTYGQLTDAGNIANKRSLVFGRQDPVSLAEKMAVGHGGPIATAFN